MLRFAQNPRDRVAGFRLMHLVPGVGPSSAHRILEQMAGQADPLSALCEIPAPPRSGADWNAFVDKRMAVLLLLNSEKWAQWSNREIARHCKVSNPFVAKVRSDRLETFPDAGNREGTATVPPPLDVGAADAPAVPEGPQPPSSAAASR